jgi:hypothetical protein
LIWLLGMRGGAAELFIWKQEVDAADASWRLQ